MLLVIIIILQAHIHRVQPLPKPAIDDCNEATSSFTSSSMATRSKTTLRTTPSMKSSLFAKFEPLWNGALFFALFLGSGGLDGLRLKVGRSRLAIIILESQQRKPQFQQRDLT